MYKIEPPKIEKVFRRDKYTDVRQTLKRLGMDTQIGDIISNGFVTGQSGWRIAANGDVEFNSGVFRGTFNIGGTSITITPDENIYDYLNIVANSGGGSLYLQPGTYLLTNDLEIPSGVSLIGASRDEVIIDCNNSYSVKINGSNSYTVGTVSINNGSTTVTGVGTSFTSGMIGQYIYLDRIWYEITGFTDSTHIAIGSAYSNNNLLSALTVIADINTNSQLTTLTIINSSGSAVQAMYSQEVQFNNVNVFDSGKGIDLQYVVYPRINVTCAENGVNLYMNNVGGFDINFCLFGTSTTGAGVEILNSGDATFFNSSVTGNFGNGISMTNCSRIATISVTLNLNGFNGIELINGNNNCQFSEMIIDANTYDGIRLTNDTDLITFSGLSISNNIGYGVNIANANCENNILIGCKIYNNGSGNINDSGTNTLKSTTVNYY